MRLLTESFLYHTGGLLTLVFLLHLLPRLGSLGKAFATRAARAPGLDVIITLLTAAPLILGPALWRWPGLAGAVLAQYATLLTWELAHELWHWKDTKGPRIVKVHNRIVGPARNITALILTSIGVPVFWLIRVVELIVYLPLIKLLNFPPITHSDYINVTRHRVDKLVGHDRIWCLYCDWMTGVWSLGTEMLRNVESYWCPIRFHDELKCENCVKEFPDINGGWSPFESGAEAAAKTVQDKYESPPPKHATWFGHPTRLTINGAKPK